MSGRWTMSTLACLDPCITKLTCIKTNSPNYTYVNTAEIVKSSRVCMFGLNFSIVIDHCKKLKGMLFFEVRSDSCIII